MKKFVKYSNYIDSVYIGYDSTYMQPPDKESHMIRYAVSLLVRLKQLKMSLHAWLVSLAISSTLLK